MSKSLARRDSGLISSLPDKRQHGGETGQRWQRGGGGGGGVMERYRGKKGGREERYKMGGRGKGRWELERWRLCCCNKKVGGYI